MISELIKASNVEKLRALLESGEIDVARQNEHGFPPLHVATLTEKPEIIDLLLEQGADINARDKFQSTPLHIAANEGLLATTAHLLKYKPDLELRATDGYTPFHFTVSRRRHDVMRLLLEHGAEINTLDDEGLTPIFTAIVNFNGSQGDVDMVEFLLSKGADPSITSMNGAALHQCLEGPIYKDVRSLLEC